jgi:hypothetical protein
MIVVQLLKCMFRADLVIRTLLSKFRVIGHKRLVLRRVGNARKGGSLGRGLVALLLEEIRRNCPGQDPNDSADARPNGAEIVVCGYPERGLLLSAMNGSAISRTKATGMTVSRRM